VRKIRSLSDRTCERVVDQPKRCDSNNEWALTDWTQTQIRTLISELQAPSSVPIWPRRPCWWPRQPAFGGGSVRFDGRVMPGRHYGHGQSSVRELKIVQKLRTN